MCALCGILGGSDHWADAVPRAGVFTRNTGGIERRRERDRRVVAANRILRPYGMRVADWQGVSLVLSTATGKTELVADLTHLWAAAERLRGVACDPLDPGLLDRLEAADA